MKYKKGSLVEVLTTKEAPYHHSWRCAQIVSCKGHNYTVRFDVYPGFTNEVKVEHVSRKLIRPCPPTVEMYECSPGDVVEVFHDLSWKMAIVSKAFTQDLFLVRLVGSFLEFKASKSELRVRQFWQNREWAFIGKARINTEDAQCNKLKKHKLISVSQEKQRESLQESHIVSTRTLKRGSPYCFSQDEVNEAQKYRLIQKGGRRLKVVMTSPKKVDTCLDNRAAGSLYVGDVAREDLSGADSVTSSIGSCSINSYSGFEDIEGCDSDAESGCQEDVSLCKNEKELELAGELHRLELQAYRRTIEALHASGPLSWEKESMVTNLRMSLHISNDEHLILLKNLISSIRNR